MMKQILFAILWALLCAVSSFAQPSQQIVSVRVSPLGAVAKASINSVADAYNFDEKKEVKFKIEVISSGVPLDGAKVSYTICEDKMPARKSGDVVIKNGEAIVNGGTMNNPGFLRCSAQTVIGGKKYSGACAVGFSPQNILPTVSMPDDFKQWWDGQLAQLSKIKPAAEMRLLPERCTSRVNVYQVKISSVTPVYGILAVPKASGSYPAVMRLPGAGVHKIGGYIAPAEADDAVITLDLGIHSIPFDADDDFYSSLSAGVLYDYPSIGIASCDAYYYRHVYLNCVKAAEYLTTLEKFDGKNLFVVGGSQGGALSIVTAALCTKVTAIMAFFPALCDQQAYLYGRAGGWPHYFLFHKDDANVKDAQDVIRYFDVVNFARMLSVPVFMSFGYNDLTCAPTSTYSAWNSISSKDKKLLVVPETGHWRYAYQWDEGWKWMMQFRK